MNADMLLCQGPGKCFYHAKSSGGLNPTSNVRQPFLQLVPRGTALAGAMIERASRDRVMEMGVAAAAHSGIVAFFCNLHTRNSPGRSSSPIWLTSNWLFSCAAATQVSASRIALNAFIIAVPLSANPKSPRCHGATRFSKGSPSITDEIRRVHSNPFQHEMRMFYGHIRWQPLQNSSGRTWWAFPV